MILSQSNHNFLPNIHNIYSIINTMINIKTKLIPCLSNKIICDKLLLNIKFINNNINKHEWKSAYLDTQKNHVHNEYKYIVLCNQTFK